MRASVMVGTVTVNTKRLGSSPVREHKADNDIAGARAQSGQGIAGAWHKAGAAQQQQGIYSRQRGSSAMGGKREMMGREKGGRTV